MDFQKIRSSVFEGIRKTSTGKGDSGGQKDVSVSLTDVVGSKKKSSTPITSDKNTLKKTTNVNLDQGKTVNVLRTTTSYFDDQKFDPDWNAFVQQKDGSMQWIPEQIVGISEDFHSQVGDGKVKTTLYH